MFRSTMDALDVLAKLKAQDVGLHMIDLGGDVTGNGISKLVFTILSAVAEAERDRTRERVADVKRDQRQRGRYLGGKRPFGWHVSADGTLMECPEEQAAIDRVRTLRRSGASLRTVAAALREDGHILSHEAVRSVLARERQPRA